VDELLMHTRLAGFDEFCHAFVATGERAFGGFVAFDEGAGTDAMRVRTLAQRR